MSNLIGIVITHDINQHDEPAFFVTPRYEVPNHDGGTVCVSVPDNKGWPTHQEAIADVASILASNDIDEMHAGDLIRDTTLQGC